MEPLAEVTVPQATTLHRDGLRATPPPRSEPTLAIGLAAGVLSGVLMWAAFAPLDIWPAAPVGVAVLALAVRRRPMRASAVIGLASGLGFFVPLLAWAGSYVGPIPWFALALLEALFVAAVGPLLTLAWSAPSPLRECGIAGLWVAQELVRSRLPWGGFPWGRLGFAMPDAPVRQAAAVGGVALVSALVAFAGAAVASAAHGSGPRRWLLVAVAALAVTLPAVTGSTSQPPNGRTVVVALVQGNVPRAGLDFNAQRRAVLDNHVRQTHLLAADVRAGRVRRPDLVLWPENSSDVDPLRDPAAAAAIGNAVDDIDAPVLVGAVLQGPNHHLLNAAILWRPHSGPVTPFYVKRHPAPFGEYIPLRSIAGLFSADVDRVTQDFAAGKDVGAIVVPTAGGSVTLGDVICFEVAYDSLVRDTVSAGGQLLSVQTNNATFGHSQESAQQLAMTRMRAIETARWTLSVSTSGISAVIGPDGDVHQRTGLFEARVLVAPVVLSDRRTPAVTAGAWPERALAILGAFVAVIGWRRRQQSGHGRRGDAGTIPARAAVVGDEGVAEHMEHDA